VVAKSPPPHDAPLWPGEITLTGWGKIDFATTILVLFTTSVGPSDPHAVAWFGLEAVI
jgi:hypothetical protein